LRIGGLAANVQMSVFAFHHHFRQITAMSPLQFQKSAWVVPAVDRKTGTR
jgi:methylphosphotriester-DNA--protein-cysteine methyltransferase